MAIPLPSLDHPQPDWHRSCLLQKTAREALKLFSDSFPKLQLQFQDRCTWVKRGTQILENEYLLDSTDNMEEPFWLLGVPTSLKNILVRKLHYPQNIDTKCAYPKTSSNPQIHDSPRNSRGIGVQVLSNTQSHKNQ